MEPHVEYHDSLRDPRFLTALVLLLANDFVLKNAWPGVISGKLSDLAGMVFFPVVMTSLLHVLRIGAGPVLGLVAVWFTGLQLSPTVDSVHESLLSFVLPWNVINTPDPTDLVALVVLPITYRILTNPSPITFRAGSQRLIVGLVLVGCLAETGPDSDTIGPPIVNEAGELEVLRSGDFSQRGGSTVDVEGPLRSVAVVPLEFAAFHEAIASSPGVREECLTSQPERCFRLGESVFVVEESVDGGETWQKSWAITEDRYLLREQGNSFQFYDERQRGIVVLEDDTVFVTTAIGPLLTWTEEGGWTPSPRSLRIDFWQYFAAAATLATAAILLPLFGLGLGRALVGSVFGLFAALATALWSILDYFAALFVGGLALGAGAVFVSFFVAGIADTDKWTARQLDRRLVVAIVFVALAVGTLPLLSWLAMPTLALSQSLTALAFIGGPVVFVVAVVIDQKLKRQISAMPPVPQ
ncbi:MAG: hypothetical protein R8J94_10575 [Acidimicrobiia bacterium]|nr:hypothetical protein [Acidimicrobiia bacterium]